MTALATPDPAPFDIHAQPTWIALGIGKLRREYSDIKQIVGASRDEQGGIAWVTAESPAATYRACLLKSAVSGAGTLMYVDEVTR